MFWTIWNYFRGYVIIGVYGFSVERFLNLAAYKGIYLWDIKPHGAMVSMKVSIKGYKKLRECGIKTKCRYKIIKKCGMPFRTHKYKKRKFLGGGILFFVIALYFLSSFVWVLNIEGNERIKTEEISSYCSDVGLKPGGIKFGLNTKKIADGLLSDFEDIAWVSVSIKGTKATVKIVETIPKTYIVNNESPSDIVAAKDGIIVSIATSSGTPMVREQDAVKAGDVLVSSLVHIKDGETEVGTKNVRSKAVVVAKLWYDYNETVEKTYTEKVYTDKTYEDMSIVINNKVINIIKPNLNNQEYEILNIYKKYFKIGDYQFPFGIIKDKYTCYNNVEKVRTTEECEDILNKSLEKKIQELEADGIDVLSVDKSYEDNESNLRLSATITVTERIDSEVAVSSNEGSMTDGVDGESN